MIYASDGTSARLEELQFDLGEGPTYDTFTTAAPVLVPDIDDEDRWPAFLADATDLPVRALFVFPLMLGAACIGTLLSYCTNPGPLDNFTIETGVSLGRAVAGPAFRTAIELAHDEDPDSDAPIETRRQVHQATGMVLHQLDTTATNAFSRMRAYAFTNGSTMRDVARAVVETRLDFSALPE